MALKPATNRRSPGEWSTTHGASKSPAYASWAAMHQRCTNPKCSAYPQYGGRGISVAPEWRDFSAFLRDMGPRPEGTTLDRIDVNEGYSPANCRWATRSEQQRNRRDTRRLVLGGTDKTVAEWAAQIGIDPNALLKRVRRGWTDDEILSTPPDRANSVKRKSVRHQRNSDGKFTARGNHGHA